MFDAYTVKKVLPRLVIAVILIQLSWFIFTGMLALTNSIAYGIEALIYAPFGGGADNFTLSAMLSGLDSSGTTIFTTAAIGVAVVAFAGGVIPVLLLILAAIIVAIVALTLRRMVLILLLLLAPLALVAWILPNTERFWKMWWDNYTKLLLMYPIILIMIAAGRVFGKIASDSDGSDIINVAIILGGFFLPLLLIPKTFAIAGTAFATLGGAIDRAGQKGGSSAGTWGKEKRKEWWGKTGYKLGKEGKKDAKLNTRRQSSTAKGVSKALEGSGIRSRLYKRGLSDADQASLGASADSALINAQAEGFVHTGVDGTELVDIATDESRGRHEREAALKALAMQGEGAYLIQASHRLHGTEAGQEIYNSALRSNYQAFAGAGAGTTEFLGGHGSVQDLAQAQTARYGQASHQELAAMGPRGWWGYLEANEVGTRGPGGAPGNHTDATARHAEVVGAATPGSNVEASLKIRDPAQFTAGGTTGAGIIGDWASKRHP